MKVTTLVALDITSGRAKWWSSDVHDSGIFSHLRIFSHEQVFESSLFDHPLMIPSWLLDSQWLTWTIADNPPYQRYLLSTWQSKWLAGWLTHLSQVPYLSACVWTRLDCCTHSQFRVRPTHSRDQFTCSSKVSLFLPSSLHVPLMILPSYHLTLVSLVFDSKNIKLVLHWRHKEEQISPKSSSSLIIHNQNQSPYSYLLRLI